MRQDCMVNILFPDCKVPTDCTERRVRVERGGRQNASREVRRLLGKSEDDDRDSCTGGHVARINDSPVFLWINDGANVFFSRRQGGGKGSKAGLESCASSDVGGPQAKKHAGDKKLTAEKKKMMKEKKRTLKRL